jgi:hypothetical protein
MLRDMRDARGPQGSLGLKAAVLALSRIPSGLAEARHIV